MGKPIANNSSKEVPSREVIQTSNHFADNLPSLLIESLLSVQILSMSFVR